MIQCDHFKAICAKTDFFNSLSIFGRVNLLKKIFFDLFQDKKISSKQLILKLEAYAIKYFLLKTCTKLFAMKKIFCEKNSENDHFGVKGLIFRGGHDGIKSSVGTVLMTLNFS